jgi:hypothetical protein
VLSRPLSSAAPAARVPQRLDAEGDEHDGTDDPQHVVGGLGRRRQCGRSERGNDIPEEHAGLVAEHVRKPERLLCSDCLTISTVLGPGDAAMRVQAPRKAMSVVGMGSS